MSAPRSAALAALSEKARHSLAASAFALAAVPSNVTWVLLAFADAAGNPVSFAFPPNLETSVARVPFCAQTNVTRPKPGACAGPDCEGLSTTTVEETLGAFMRGMRRMRE